MYCKRTRNTDIRRNALQGLSTLWSITDKSVYAVAGSRPEWLQLQAVVGWVVLLLLNVLIQPTSAAASGPQSVASHFHVQLDTAWTFHLRIGHGV